MIRTQPLFSFSPLSALALALAGGCWALVAIATFRCGGKKKRWALLVGSIGVVGVSSLFFRAAEPINGDGKVAGVTRMVPVPGTIAFTDRGSIVPVGLPLTPDPDDAIPDGFQTRVIAVGNADSSSNCHGWVFAEGRYWIPMESVDTILRDNAYVRVETPSAGDLVVYRDHKGRPVHTGVVKALGDDDFVLVESKWGQFGVFWHTPMEQAYGDQVEYWHGAREGHSLRTSSRSASGGAFPRAGSGGNGR